MTSPSTQRHRSRDARHRMSQNQQTTQFPGTFQLPGRSHPKTRTAEGLAGPAVHLESDPDVDKLYLVTVRKYDIDAHSPWWRRLYFRVIYLPFVRRSFTLMKIPAQGCIDADGRFSWLEYIGIATDEETAKKMCEGEFYEHHPLPVNSALPRQSIQYGEQVYEKARKPHRFAERAFPKVQSLKDIAAERDVLSSLEALSKRILHKSQHSPL